ncbi:MAG: hypothetical protein KJ658_14800, partial [Proteobacteria bacterium]|nr:hypothetical protein [Pseudomonadota bacterium]
GFEAEVVFSDPRVAWAATLIPFACHTILRSMSDPHSPIFWKNETKEISQKANAFLVEESLSLISRAKEHSGNPGQGEAQRIKKEISGRIKALLN